MQGATRKGLIDKDRGELPFPVPWTNSSDAQNGTVRFYVACSFQSVQVNQRTDIGPQCWKRPIFPYTAGFPLGVKVNVRLVANG